VADFHLDELDGLFNALGNSARGWAIRRWRRWVAAHKANLIWGIRTGPSSSVSGWIGCVNRGGAGWGGLSAGVVTHMTVDSGRGTVDREQKSRRREGGKGRNARRFSMLGERTVLAVKGASLW
jgi:hypothetical protein